MAQVTGNLKDYGLAPVPGFKLTFWVEGASFSGTDLLAPRKVIVDASDDGSFQAELAPTEGLNPPRWYRLDIAWPTSDTQPQGVTRAPMIFNVPESGGPLSDLLAVELGPAAIITKGDKGDKGDTGADSTVPGPSNQLTIGTVTTGPAAASITGSSPSQVLNLTVPQGAQGVQGPVGATGAGVPAGGAGLQLIRKKSDNSTTEWVTPDKTMVSLGNVDNTADANKPVSTAANARLKAVEPLGPNTSRTGAYGSLWQAALASKAKPVVAIVGDSIAKKFNASSIAKSWVGLMTAELKALKGDGGTGFRGMADAGYSGGTFLSGFWDQYATDDKVTLSGSAWGNSTDPGFPYSGPGLTMGSTTTAGATASFRVAGDTINVFFLGVTSTGGTFSVAVDGAAAVSYTTGSKPANACLKQQVKTGAGTGMHTVVITLVSGGLNLYGVSAENTAGVVVNNFSRGGVSAQMVAGGTNAGADWNGGTQYPADLVIYALGVNDLATTDAQASQVADHCRRFVSAMREAGSTAEFVMVANHPGKKDVNYRQQAIQARLREIAQAFDGAYLQMWPKYRSNWGSANSAGYWGSTATIGISGTDDVHPGDTGHASMWQELKPLIIAS